jgi:hypothetical protein
LIFSLGQKTGGSWSIYAEVEVGKERIEDGAWRLEGVHNQEHPSSSRQGTNKKEETIKQIKA